MFLSLYLACFLDYSENYFIPFYFHLEIAEYEQSIKKNVAKYNVYKNAAKVVFDYTKKITSGKEALELNGINEKIAGKIDEFLQTGKVPKVEQVWCIQNLM